MLPGAGPPGPAIRAYAEDADLLVLLWHRVTAVGRALVVRSVLGDGVALPCLLVPIAWLESLRAGPDTGIRSAEVAASG